LDVDSIRRAKGDDMLNLTTVMIYSEDPDALNAFYTKVLGERSWENGGYVGWQAGNATLMTGPHSEVKGRNEMPGRIIVNFETPDVKGEFERIKALGAKVEQEPYAPGEEPEMLLATFEDPDGNFFQLATPMKAE
jgi:predicted enzyme related to lactoylglutathione lyase